MCVSARTLSLVFFIHYGEDSTGNGLCGVCQELGAAMLGVGWGIMSGAANGGAGSVVVCGKQMMTQSVVCALEHVALDLAC